MKQLLFVFISFFYFSLQSSAQVSNADTMVQKIFKAVKNEDDKAFKSLFPDFVQLKQMLKASYEGELVGTGKNLDKQTTDSIVNMFMGFVTEEDYATEQEKLIENFKKFIKQGKDNKISWKNIQFKNAVTEEFNENGFKNLKGIIHFNNGKDNCQFSFNQVIWSGVHKGWFGATLENLMCNGKIIGVIVEDIDQ